MGRALMVPEIPAVALLTDFGLSDHFVGTMKGVLLNIAPPPVLVDITHDIPPQDVRAAAYQLMAAYRFFPRGTLFMCVVDPGVGTDRKILYAEAGEWRFLAPDNGLLSWVFHERSPQSLIKVDVERVARAPVSATFHGRDVFAPAALRLLGGEAPQVLGEPTDEWVALSFPLVRKSGTVWDAEIIAVDRFGNLITNVRVDEIGGLAQHSRLWVEISGRATIRGLASSYSAVEEGKFLAIVGSAGLVEIAVRNGSAAERSGLKVGDPLQLLFRL